MWILRFRLLDKNCIWATRCKKFKIFDYQYPLGSYKVGGESAVMMYHILEGDENSKRGFIRDVREDGRVKKLGVENSFLISLAVEKRPVKEFYNPKLICIRPGINYPDGTEQWELGSFDKRDLVRLIELCRRHYQGKLLYLREVNAPRLFIPQLMPKLTEKQLWAFRSASASGYYEFPRQTTLGKLAERAGVSRPTFEEHIRKAENKLLGFMKELILH
jgi:predicted DNA binding protein